MRAVIYDPGDGRIVVSMEATDESVAAFAKSHSLAVLPFSQVTGVDDALFPFLDGLFKVVNGKLVALPTAAPDPMKSIRMQRNARADECLWALDPASPLSWAQQELWKVYRAQLHRVTIDIPASGVVAWPTPPAVVYPSTTDRLCGEVDRAVTAKARGLLTPGAHKAMLYQAKQAEVKAYRSLTTVLLAALDGATMQSSYPTLMAMVAVYVPAATTDATKRTALAQMVTKVEAGIAASMARLRTADALGLKAKDDIRAAVSDAQRNTILSTAITAIAGA